MKTRRIFIVLNLFMVLISLSASIQLVKAQVQTLFYETEFEDASKTAYAEGTVTLSDSIWTFSDALIGTLRQDSNVSGNSVRIRNGYIDTEFSVVNISQVIFYAGNYDKDADTTVHFQISLDGISWVTVDSFTTTKKMVEHNYIFDAALFTSLSLDSTEDYFMRIVSDTNSRTNIDNFQVYTKEPEVIITESLFYETEFEDASKASYAEATVTLSDSIWTFSDALIGNLSGDLDVSGNSVRIRDGYIDTEFSIINTSRVIFYAGTYGSDADTTVHFQISLDGISWVTVDSFTTTSTMVEHSYIFDAALFTSLSLDSTEDYFMRILSDTTARTNIDNFSIYTGEPVVTDPESLYTITLTANMVYEYLLGDIVDLTTCEATHTVTGVTTCDTLGTVNTVIAGIYEVTFYKTDEYDNTASITVNISVIDPDEDYLLMDLITYYDDAEGLSGENLMDALNIIINTGFVGVNYGDARYILDETDQDPNNPNNIILVYLQTSVSGVWDSGVTWNREHVWPQSLLGVSASNSTVNIASDLYNLMPANPSENSSRSNHPYTAILSGYEPPDERKGDVARALFYMVIMYDHLNLVNTAPELYEMGYLDELLEWHLSDPVDDFEENRLDVIFSYQLNRNPFVDYPHFVELIWGTE